MSERKINGRTFRVDRLLATQALVLQARIAKTVGPAVDKLPAMFAGRARPGVELSAEAEGNSNAAAIAAFAAIFTNNESTAVAALVSDIVSIAQIQGSNGAYTPVDFDRDFTESLADIVPVAIFVLQEQFGDFFTALLVNGRQSLTRQAKH